MGGLKLIEPNDSAAVGANMTLQRRLEVVTPLPALRPLDKSLNALTGGHGCSLADLPPLARFRQPQMKSAESPVRQ
jgi:hypothetical protein